MKKLLFLALLTAASHAANVATKFDYDLTGVVRCSATVTTSCLVNFEAGTFKDGVFASLGSSALPAGGGPVAGITGPAFAINSYGSQTISVVAVGKDAQGARITSDPAAATANVVITPASPKNITVTVTVNVAIP